MAMAMANVDDEEGGRHGGDCLQFPLVIDPIIGIMAIIVCPDALIEAALARQIAFLVGETPTQLMEICYLRVSRRHGGHQGHMTDEHNFQVRLSPGIPSAYLSPHLLRFPFEGLCCAGQAARGRFQIDDRSSDYRLLLRFPNHSNTWSFESSSPSPSSRESLSSSRSGRGLGDFRCQPRPQLIATNLLQPTAPQQITRETAT
ncbi:hypothetical protein BO86DRAFT_115849 [Aspergillus japonicus CBS 114.51]|uniref:Uncharacterized protein n=1 Tax=Aspergillus japonicus CBS 114.51 TaxID=1448312 RepID=A0A8T8XH66_ASPJA|nr:hypothetical protein BO86DRAFT_115849 [Aspergillus japonicus CBS 114.51]RAH86672.1 hypothetical protein BO86DRAFT_115849 [Aspergillus japonicus CBS 114.51]